MKPIYAHFTGAIALTFALAACIPAAPRRAPPIETRPTPTPTPTPSPAPVVTNWMDAPQTPGDWSYRDVGSSTQAFFGDPANWQQAFAIRCDRATKRIELSRPTGGSSANRITVRAEALTRTLPATPGPIAVPASTVAVLAPRDPLLDAMALSKGRFAVETPGLPTLYLPSWAEVTRVIEDCR